MGVDEFATSDEAFAADALFEAYRSGDAAEVKKCIQTHSLFLELDNQVCLKRLIFLAPHSADAVCFHKDCILFSAAKYWLRRSYL